MNELVNSALRSIFDTITLYKSKERFQEDIANLTPINNYDLGLVSVTSEQTSTLDRYVRRVLNGLRCI